MPSMPSSSAKPSLLAAVEDAARLNVADRLAEIARLMPDAVAVAKPGGSDMAGHHGYATCTFGELDADATALAQGLVDWGVQPGERLVLLVRPGVEFVKLVFALLRSGATTVLIDPGMPRRHLLDCLEAVEPEGFVAISAAQAIRVACRRRFPRARRNVTVGRRWCWGGLTYRGLLERGRASAAALPATHGDDLAAVIFTSGSTGPPKGVAYTHRMFVTQAAEIAANYDLGLGGVDLACFPLFGLFNATMGVTTVFPDMDFARPAAADPQKLLAAAWDWGVTQAFASPTVWDKLSRYCIERQQRITTLRQVFSCGAPVASRVLERTLQIVAPEARMHTPYGATESLPVSTIEAQEVLGETAAATARGAGVCVGRPFPTIQWRVIPLTDAPLATLDEAPALPPGEIGELLVNGPQVSPRYWSSPSPTAKDAAANAAAKVRDGTQIWHRMGDVGYLDQHGRFWYCGRKTHCLETASGLRCSVPAEEIVNQHPAVKRSALVGVGPRPQQRPVMIVELIDPRADEAQVLRELRALAAEHELLRDIDDWRVHGGFPVDVRHNAKIDREILASWAAATPPGRQ